MRYKRRNPDVDPRLSEPDIYIIDPHTHERRVMSGVEAANYAVQLQRLLADDPTYDREGSRTRASITWHINHAMRMGYDWDELKVRLSKAKKGERSNPGVPAQRAGRSALTGEVFRVTSYGSGGEIEPFPDEADRKDFKREGEARRYARAMATKYGAAVPIIRYLFSKSGSTLHREHWTSEYPARKKNPRRRKNPDEPKWLSDARKRKKETGDPGEWFISLHDDDSGYVAHSDYFTGSREQARKKAAYYADDLIDTLRPGFNVKAHVYDPTTESTRPVFVVAPSKTRVAAKEKARRLAEATLHGDWDEVHRIRTGRSVKGRRTLR